jgi:serine/threonine-protein kinase
MTSNDSPAPAAGAPSADSAAKAEPEGADQGGLVGSVLSGRYLIERLLGTGGMGAVYQAEHTHMHKRLAVKVLHPEMTRMPEVVARFEREAMAAAHIEHPNVAAATDFGKLDDGSFFLVLEYVEGEDLRAAVARGRMSVARACHVARQMASALARAHGLGVVHRDLKPENVMLVEREGDPDFVKVLDFGIAKVPMGGLGAGSKGNGEVLTQLGMVYGTPEYMAPEQALGQEIDARADLYALGVILFEMLTGKRPYEHESKVTLLGMHVTAPIPKVRERAPDAGIPAELEAVVARLMAKEATARYESAKELIEALDAATAPAAQRGPSSEAFAVGPTSLAQPAVPAPFSGRLSLPSLPRVAQRARDSLNDALQKAPPWVTPRRVAIAGAGVAALILATAVWPSGKGKATPSPSRSLVPKVLARVVAPNLDGPVAEASTKLDHGDTAGAIDALVALEKQDGDRADIHKLLERACTAAHDAKSALREAGLWLATDDHAAADPRLQEDLRNAALVRDTQDDAFMLLESKMGPSGVDLLYDIAYGASGRQYPQAAARAKHSLDLDDVHARASPALQVLLDFKEAKTCDAKRALLDRAKTAGDGRMLSTLQAYQSTRGCGFLGVIDCYPCLHKDSALKDTIAALSDHATP